MEKTHGSWTLKEFDCDRQRKGGKIESVCKEKQTVQGRTDVLGKLSCHQIIKNLGLQHNLKKKVPGSACRMLNTDLHGSHRLTHVTLRMAIGESPQGLMAQFCG